MSFVRETLNKTQVYINLCFHCSMSRGLRVKVHQPISDQMDPLRSNQSNTLHRLHRPQDLALPVEPSKKHSTTSNCPVCGNFMPESAAVDLCAVYARARFRDYTPLGQKAWSDHEKNAKILNHRYRHYPGWKTVYENDIEEIHNSCSRHISGHIRGLQNQMKAYTLIHFLNDKFEKSWWHDFSKVKSSEIQLQRPLPFPGDNDLPEEESWQPWP